MGKLGQLALMSAFAGIFVISGCETEDTRPPLTEFTDNADLPAAEGEACGTDSITGVVVNCATGLTCFEPDADTGLGVCLRDEFAEACTPNPCSNGVCNARGEPGNVIVICRCDTGFEWDGTDCAATAGLEWPGDITADTTCPLKQLPDGTDDETTANCPDNDFTFCTTDDPDGSGDCLEVFVEFTGMIGGNMVGGSVTGGTALTDAVCTRQYKASGDAAGFQLDLTGALAGQLFGGASAFNMNVTNCEVGDRCRAPDAGEDPVEGKDVLGTRPAIFYPQADGTPDPRESDTLYVDVTVTSTTSPFTGSGIGGAFAITSVLGPDDDEDDLIDDGEGTVGAEVYVGLGNGDFIEGTFTVECGNNTTFP